MPPFLKHQLRSVLEHYGFCLLLITFNMFNVQGYLWQSSTVSEKCENIVNYLWHYLIFNNGLDKSLKTVTEVVFNPYYIATKATRLPLLNVALLLNLVRWIPCAQNLHLHRMGHHEGVRPGGEASGPLDRWCAERTHRAQSNGIIGCLHPDRLYKIFVHVRCYQWHDW